MRSGKTEQFDVSCKYYLDYRLKNKYVSLLEYLYCEALYKYKNLGFCKFGYIFYQITGFSWYYNMYIDILPVYYYYIYIYIP